MPTAPTHLHRACAATPLAWALSASLAAAQFQPLQQEWAQRLDRPIVHVNSLGMSLVLIPPGDFLMGSPEPEIAALVATVADKPERAAMYRAEGPRHRITISQPFDIGRTAVTVGQFRRFVEATGHQTDAERDGQGGFGMVGHSWRRDTQYLWNRRSDFEQSDDHPVVNVSWHDAVAFCLWLTKSEQAVGTAAASQPGQGTYRLPTEAEWEYACRAGSTSPWHTGDEPASIAAGAWLRDNSDWHTHPVGQRAPNGFGLCDLQGNARNWCHDLFAPGYYAESPAIDPQGPLATPAGERELRIVRGSAFHYRPDMARSATRFADPPEHRIGQLGFRVVRTVE